MIDTQLLDNIIVGRVKPHIYAFCTNTIPNYLKVGDTYRPVNVRINEWRQHYENLIHDDNWRWVAQTEDGKYFRDYAVHYYLENIKQLHRLQPNEIADKLYYSKEFFQNAKPEDIDAAILDIEEKASLIGGPYQFYTEEHLPIIETYELTKSFDPRPNQKATIIKFNEARENGRRNLLMYAVMRFGKSFTSMCCATEMQAKVVLIVSAKADVKREWKETVESHTRFVDYDFLDSESLIADNNAITNAITNNRCVAVFLTLQDLMGEDIKTKHADLFKHTIDLLIVDETHFGARAEEYGKILREKNNLTAAQAKNEYALSQESTIEDLENGLELIKELKVDTTLHLSGTPYRILMGSEFKPEDIIAFYQFTDIIDDKEKYDRDNLNNDDYKEWDNPYYGFPQMVRFAFNPNESSRKLLEKLKEDGKSAQLNELFRPLSITKDNSADKKHRLFVHEKEVFDLLKVIDGSAEDDNLLGFLNYDKLKEGKMCRHIVMVLPFCASCDAMEKILLDNKQKFININEYEVVNISGLENTFHNTEAIKQHIKNLEQSGKKSITLTVNRMLTGSTVHEWDTMLFLKDVSSPQEYDQAIFRLQNQYVTTYVDENGDKIKYNMKPQTLLVDFDPTRMFYMQEQKSKIYNINTEERGNDKLNERIRRELEISPIIVLNHGKIGEVTPTDILNAVRNYSANKTVMEEATSIPTDFELLEDARLWDIIKEFEPINNNKGISIKPVEGEGDDYDIDTDPDALLPRGELDDDNQPLVSKQQIEDDQRDKRLASLFARILFFALLTDDNVRSLQQVIDAIYRSIENQRIARNVGLQFQQLRYLRKHLNPYVLSDLDYKINNISDLLCDETHTPVERVQRALLKFGRLSDSEIVTPSAVASQVVGLLPKEQFDSNSKFLDIASKQGEFACALYEYFGEDNRKNIYALPTSKLTYEFTLKVFRLLDIPASNVFSTFTSYDLIGNNKDNYITILKNMKFNAVVGNPPYQKMDGGAGASAVPIYNHFVNEAKELTQGYVSMIMPSRWMTGGRGLDDFRQSMITDRRISRLFDFYNANECFDNVEIKGGICYFLWDKDHDGPCHIYTKSHNGYEQESQRLLKDGDENIFIRDSKLIQIKNKVAKLGEESFETIVSSMKPYGIRGDFFKNPAKYGLPPIKSKKSEGDITIIGLDDRLRRTRRYVKSDYPLPNRELLENIKLFAPRNYGTGRMGDLPSNLEYAMPYEACTETFVQIGPFNSIDEAKNCEAYMRTKLFTVLVGIRKQDQGAGKAVYHYAPLQDFSIRWTDEMLYKKYGISKEEQEYIEQIIS